MKNAIRGILVFIIITFCFPAISTQAQTADTATVEQLLEEASKYIGTPYHWGGKTPKGFDCAGFTRYIYGKFGVSLSSSAGAQYKEGKHVERKDLKVGDLVFFGGRKNTHSIGHVGIVTEVEEGGTSFFFIHASSTGVRITSSKDPYYVKRYIKACRVVENWAQSTDSKELVIIDTVVAMRTAMPMQEEREGVFIHTICPDEDAFRATTATAPLANDKGLIFTIAMVGDMMLGTTYPIDELPKNDGENLFDDVQDILQRADIAAGNCEGAICESGYCTKEPGKYSFAFRMPPSYTRLFQKAGFDFLSLANNHIYDFDRSGMKETMQNLDTAGIKYAGAKGLCEYTLLRKEGIVFGFCAFGHNSYNCRHLDEVAAMEIIKQLRDSCDILIVSIHGGAEGKSQAHLPMGREIFYEENRGDLRRFAHLCIDQGTDIVFGHGPHVCRAMESYKGHLIAYSLGNFCTPAGMNINGILGYAPVLEARINIKGELIDGQIHSFIQKGANGPRRDPKNKAAQAIRELTKEDFDDAHLLITNNGYFIPLK
ncbi:MAG: CapA family protein [Bacteroidales bacterium]|nr:CapA family protein [Bacteroidales bacterium]